MKTPPDPEFMLRDDFPPDLAARTLIMASYAYYVLDNPLMSDGLYDRLSNHIADKWPLLLAERQWALDNPDDTRASGAHFKFCTRAVFAVAAEFAKLGRSEPPTPETWLFDETFGHYVTAVM